MSRIDKENYYLDIAETVLERSTCRRVRSGAIIVRNDEIVSTGYNGAPPGPGQLHRLGPLHLGSGVAAPRAGGMSSAGVCMPRPMPSSPPPAASVWAGPFIW